MVVERGTGRRVDEPRPFSEHARIVLVWTTFTGSRLLCRMPWFLRYLERMSIDYGAAMDEPATPERIERFIADYDVDVQTLDRAPREFATVNDLFSRPLRPGTLVVDVPGDPAVAVCPGDGRLTCVHLPGERGRVRIKGRWYDVGTLLGVDAAASSSSVRGFHMSASSDGFSLSVLRLAPGDYHRFHWPVDGRWDRENVLDLEGEYHSVAPPCLGGPVDVLGRNRRVVTTVASPVFGTVAVVVVGAVRVGSIELSAVDPQVVKGAEMGRFRYGGSTVAVVFRRGSIDFDAEVLHNSGKGLETFVRVGSHLGVTPGSGGRS